MKKTLLSLFAIAAMNVATAQIYVNANAAGFNNGTSWNDAYFDVSQAIYNATAGDTIWVAQATYSPGVDENGSNISGTGSYFWLKDGVVVLGGFVGTETSVDQRDPVNNKAILTGGNTSYHVLKVDADDTAVLDGFMVVDGKATGLSDTSGGGLFLTGDAQFHNVRFTSNTSMDHGAGIFASGSNSLFVNCEFDDNNTTLYDGGAGYLQDSDIEFFNCEFSNNFANRFGGALCLVNSNAFLQNATIVDNDATNNVFQLSNTMSATDSFYVDISHSIIYGNTGSVNVGMQANVFFTVEESWSEFDGAANPMFVDYNGGNYRLDINSPCVDPAIMTLNPYNPYSDLDGNARVSGSGIDMGAYEYQQGVGMDEKDILKLNLYPNPAVNTVLIESNSTVQSVNIINMAGVVVQTETKTSFSVQELAEGAYFVQIKTESGLETIKLIKK
jgi:hypothetical protein